MPTPQDRATLEKKRDGLSAQLRRAHSDLRAMGPERAGFYESKAGHKYSALESKSLKLRKELLTVESKLIEKSGPEQAQLDRLVKTRMGSTKNVSREARRNIAEAQAYFRAHGVPERKMKEALSGMDVHKPIRTREIGQGSEVRRTINSANLNWFHGKDTSAERLGLATRPRATQDFRMRRPVLALDSTATSTKDRWTRGARTDLVKMHDKATGEKYYVKHTGTGPGRLFGANRKAPRASRRAGQDAGGGAQQYFVADQARGRDSMVATRSRRRPRIRNKPVSAQDQRRAGTRRAARRPNRRGKRPQQSQGRLIQRKGAANSIRVSRGRGHKVANPGFKRARNAQRPSNFSKIRSQRSARSSRSAGKRTTPKRTPQNAVRRPVRSAPRRR